MGQGADRARLGDEALTVCLVLGVFRAQDLDRNDALDVRVVCPVHDRHGAAAKFALYPITAECFHHAVRSLNRRAERSMLQAPPEPRPRRP